MDKLLTRIILKLARKNIVRISDKKYLTLVGKVLLNQKMDIDNPKTFNEKLQWLKINDRNPEYTKMADKYEAKEYISNIIGKEYIIPTIGVYKKFEDIDFEKLPDQFVIKTTHDSGSVIICKDKKSFDIEKAKEKIEKSLKRKYYNLYREWPYKDINPRILIEKYMATEKQPELIDYKFFCFNGEPKFIYVSEGLSNHETAKISFVDIDYKMMNFHRKDYRPFEKLPPKPRNFETMKELAKKLSKNIPFLRVDFYEIENKIFFGELTFYPCAGYLPFQPEEYDKVLGDMIDISNIKRK